MKRRPVTFVDLDRLLVGLGFEARRPAHTHVVYTLPKSDVVVLLPPWSPGDNATPFHVASVRGTLIDFGLLDDDDFEQWLCAVRFGTECREPAGAGVRDATTG